MVRAEYAPVRDNKAWQWDDIFLTMVVFVAACQDLAFGVWRIGWPSNYLENINSVVLPSIDDDTTRLTRVGGVGQVERGCANFLLVAYRVMRCRRPGASVYECFPPRDRCVRWICVVVCDRELWDLERNERERHYIGEG